MPRARTVLDDPTRLEMRKRPQQARSKNTVAIIKQAALELLARDGLSACGTDRIAERAGLSIGSLYKYFPNRESVLRALYEDASLEYARLVGSLTLKILDMATETGMELTMRSVLALHEKNHLVLLRLVSEAPELKLESQPMAFHNLVRTNIRAYVQHRNPALKRKEISHRCFFIERVAFSSFQGYMSDPPADMSPKIFARYLGHLIARIIDEPPAQ